MPPGGEGPPPRPPKPPGPPRGPEPRRRRRARRGSVRPPHAAAAWSRARSLSSRAAWADDSSAAYDAMVACFGGRGWGWGGNKCGWAGEGLVAEWSDEYDFFHPRQTVRPMNWEDVTGSGRWGMAPAKSRYAPSGQIVATGRGLYIRSVRSEYSFPFVFSPRVTLSVSPLEQNRILGDTDLGEVAEAAPPTSDGSESNLSSASPVSC